MTTYWSYGLLMNYGLCTLRYRKRELEREQILEEAENETFICPGETINDLIEQSQSSGSGSGLPLLVSTDNDGKTRVCLCW